MYYENNDFPNNTLFSPGFNINEENPFDSGGKDYYFSKELYESSLSNDSYIEHLQNQTHHDIQKEKKQNKDEELSIQKKQGKTSPMKSTFFTQNNINDLNIEKNLENIENYNIEEVEINDVDNIQNVDNKENADNIINTEIKINSNTNKEKNNKRGRKKLNSGETGLHTKHYDDNMMRRINKVSLENLRKYINNLIRVLFWCNLFQKRELSKLKVENKKFKIDYNQNLLKEKIKDIFSGEISVKNKKKIYTKDYNKKLINELLLLYEKNKDKISEEESSKEKSPIEKIYFIFNLTYLEYLKIFRKEIIIEELNDLPKVDEVCKKLKNDIEYKKKFINFISNYEKIINSKKSRNRSKY